MKKMLIRGAVAFLIGFLISVTLTGGWEQLRFWIICMTVDSPLPEWLKAFLWGWY